MATLQSTADQAWRQCYPNPSDETAVSKEEFIATAKSEWAYQTLMMAYNEMQRDGYFEPPSYLLSETELTIENNEADISKLKTFKSLPQDVLLVKIGWVDLSCDCNYIKSTANLSQLLCDDDSLDDAAKTYYVLGKKIKFPKGTHSKNLVLTYANMGEKIGEKIEVDDAIAALIRTRLLEIYLGKIAPQDTTNNTTSVA